MARRGRRDSRRWAQGIFRPVDYTARIRYRPPPAWYARLQWLGPLLTRWGLTPGYVITIEVPGRHTGLVRRTTVVQVIHEGERFVVALAGEAEWVRNVRAAGGRVVIRQRRAQPVTLVEVPVGDRAEVIRAYLVRAGRRGVLRVRVGEARSYFGVSAEASVDEIRAVAGHYPVFRIVASATPAGPVQTATAPPAKAWLADSGLFGATEQERRGPMPGDELIVDPMLQVTHALTVQAPVERIWPWLMQTGHGRAGFYSDSRWWDVCVGAYYRLLSREQHRPAAGYEHAGDRIVAQWQDLRVGDTIADGPPGTAEYVVRELVPGQRIVLFTDTHLPHLVPARWRGAVHGEFSSSTQLIPVDPARTRLVRRARANGRPWPFRWYATAVVVIWGEVITGRKFLRGIQRRAEAPAPGP